MLSARRFTTVPTKDCRNRLEDALSNLRPIARGEQHRGAVVAVQAALADLNRGYLFAAEIDGYYGSRTYDAVEAFQRDYGLAADGMVGRQTMMQLDSLYSGNVVRQPLGMSVHVGLNCLDAAHYGDDFALASCVNDARKMREIAESIGYDAVTFEDENATVSNFTGFMRGAIANLYDGDSLLVTFSGHGSQLPNNSADVEDDNLDETLCFFDRMLVDDEFYALLGQFREGVRVHAVFDSCHSGSVAKILKSTKAEVDEYKKTLERQLAELLPAVDEKHRPISGEDISEALDGNPPIFAKPPQPKNDTTNDIASLFTDMYADHVPSADGKNVKQIEEPEYTRIYHQYKDFYDAIRNVVGPAQNRQLSCSVITLSACQDSQTTQAGRVYSLFTYNILRSWGSGGFDGSYTQFHGSLVDIARADSTPALNTYGTNRANARLYDRPFVF